MREARIALSAGLTLTVIALAAVLSRSPATVARTNGIAAEAPLAYISRGAAVCQTGEVLSSGISAIVVSLSAFHGPRVTAQVLSGARVVTEGHQNSNWTGRTVTIPVTPLTHTIGGVTICVAFSPKHETVAPYGAPTPPGVAATYNGVTLPGRLRAEYLKPGTRPWRSFATSIVDHLGLGRAGGGAWVAFLAIALMVTVSVAVAVALLKDLR